MVWFNSDRAIYLQMADRLCDDILIGTYAEGDRVPSVRDYSIALGVNTNTAVKTYDYLGREGVIFNKRGMGYYVSPGAKEKILQDRKATFVKDKVPTLFKDMELLGISIDDLCSLYQGYVDTKALKQAKVQTAGLDS